MLKKITIIIYWLGVAVLPVLVWGGKYIHEKTIECMVIPNCAVADGLSFYWPILFTYSIIILIPVSVYKLYFTFKTMMQNERKT